MVLFGIKVRSRFSSNSKKKLLLIGESNSGRNTDKYVCTFSKLIHYWRQIWNQRTNGITDMEFPFGFVQVMKLCLFNYKHIFYKSSCQQLQI
jgi:hypothetical protein